MTHLFLITSLSLLCLLVSAWPNQELNSREYKTLLQTKPFLESVEEVLVDLQDDLSRIAAGDGANGVSGSFQRKEGTPRSVLYYDTPDDCSLARHQWTLRLRKAPSDDAWEATLKTRSGDRYHSSYRAELVKGCHAGEEGKHKFEEDISHFDWTGSVFSYSQKCYLELDEDEIDSLAFIGTVWGSMDEYLKEEFKKEGTTPLEVVGNATITEVAYEGFFIDLEDGKKDQMAEAKVSLWYDSEDDSLIVAELSMRIESKHEDWSEKTILTMHDFWELCATSLKEKWLDSESKTKTQWVYDSDPTFCYTEDPDDEETRKA
jgi:hypothetical protein